MKRIGIDIDGVLADFNTSFVKRIKEKFGVRVPLPPKTWEYHKEFINNDQNHVLWEELSVDDDFWRCLDPLDMGVFPVLMERIAMGDDLHFISTRPGKNARRTAKLWIMSMGIDRPSVFISSDKGKTAAHLELDYMYDDKPENLFSVKAARKGCKTVLIQAPYNTWAEGDARINEMYPSLEVALGRI